MTSDQDLRNDRLVFYEQDVERLEVRLESMRGDEDEVSNAVVLPRPQQLIHGPVKRLAPKPASPRIRTPTRGNTVRKRGSAKDTQAFRDPRSHLFRDDDIRPDRKMWSVLLGRTERQ